MKKVICSHFGALLSCCLSILCAGCFSRDGANRETVELPNGTTLDVERVLYRLDKPSSLMGDGFAARVAKVSPEAMQVYLDTHATERNGWRGGSVEAHDPALVDFLSRWAKAKEVYGALDESGCVWDYVRSDDAVFWTQKKLNESGRLSNGILIMILPSERLLIMLREDT